MTLGGARIRNKRLKKSFVCPAWIQVLKRLITQTHDILSPNIAYLPAASKVLRKVSVSVPKSSRKFQSGESIQEVELPVTRSCNVRKVPKTWDYGTITWVGRVVPLPNFPRRLLTESESRTENFRRVIYP